MKAWVRAVLDGKAPMPPSRQRRSVQAESSGVDAYAIELTNGGATLVSPEDYPLLRSRRWRRVLHCGIWYVTTSGSKHIPIHRVITGAKKGQYVDHANGDGLDNRRENLRVCTNRQNIRNSAKYGLKSGRKTSSQFKGVSLQPNGRYRAQIQVNGRKVNIAHFALEEDAARCYDDAASKIFGEFARLNFPQGHIRTANPFGGTR